MCIEVPFRNASESERKYSFKQTEGLERHLDWKNMGAERQYSREHVSHAQDQLGLILRQTGQVEREGPSLMAMNSWHVMKVLGT